MADTIDALFCLLAGAAFAYLLWNVFAAGAKRRRVWPWLVSGVALSCLAGYGWALLSLFVFPWLLGADFSAPPSDENVAAARPWVEMVVQQAIPFGVLIAVLGSLWTIKKRPR